MVQRLSRFCMFACVHWWNWHGKMKVFDTALTVYISSVRDSIITKCVGKREPPKSLTPKVHWKVAQKGLPFYLFTLYQSWHLTAFERKFRSPSLGFLPQILFWVTAERVLGASPVRVSLVKISKTRRGLLQGLKFLDGSKRWKMCLKSF